MAAPWLREPALTPKRADAHWTNILFDPETDPYNPPSPVPAMVSVISAVFAIAIFGFPLNAPYDISPRYTGTDSFMPASIVSVCMSMFGIAWDLFPLKIMLSSILRLSLFSTNISEAIPVPDNFLICPIF